MRDVLQSLKEESCRTGLECEQAFTLASTSRLFLGGVTSPWGSAVDGKGSREGGGKEGGRAGLYNSRPSSVLSNKKGWNMRFDVRGGEENELAG